MSDPPAGSLSPPRELPRHDNAVIVAASAGLTLIAWFYTWLQARTMTGVEDIAMPAEFGPWTISDVALNVAIWWVMMIGMMVPSAMPMILIFAAVSRSKRARGKPFVPTAVFAAVYLIAWGVFGLAATFAEWSLEQAALISPEAQRVGPGLGAGITIAAGVYQLMPLKNVCLAHCRTPLNFVLNHWREGAPGAVRMGLEHGFYCLGCCWVLMTVLFAVGVMNLLWLGVLIAFVLVEKLFPAGQWIARARGVLAIGFGAFLLAQAG
jgi:predicted metal-binding membrane protein